MKREQFVRFIAFLAIISVLFYRCYHILGYYDNIHSAAVFEQFYSLPANSVDVVWLGPSSTQEFVIPSVMYNETGISLYSLSVGNEPFFATMNLIKECENVQNPKIYMVDIRYLAYTAGSDNLMRRVTDNMKWSSNRLEAIKYMMANLKTYHQREYDSYFDYICSLTKYHTRWVELHDVDFVSDKESFFGYFIKTQVTRFDGSEIKTRFHTAAQAITNENLQYLNDLLNYCDSLGKKVIFTYTPHCLGEEYFAQYNYVLEIIQSRGYEIWDLNRAVDEIGIDYSCDFADAMHTNVYGAQKLSKYVANKLVEEYGLEDHREDSYYVAYQKMSENFNEKLQEAELKATTDFNIYLDKLIGLDKSEYTIYIAEKDIQGYNLTQDMTDKLKVLGFDQADVLLEHVYHSFIGIVANGSVVYQKIGQNDESLHYEGTINNQLVSIDSMPLRGGNTASIKLGVIEYAKNVRGLNFVIVDNKDGKILDSAAFDTHVKEMTCKR